MAIYRVKYDHKEVDTILDSLLNKTGYSITTLLIMARNGLLIPGHWYKATGYDCSGLRTSNNFRAAGHTFDILILAATTTTFFEESRAIQSSSDTYFSQSNLKAWKIWVKFKIPKVTNNIDLDWIDNSVSTIGKLYIYRMIDEFGNDCPYDFKNIQFLVDPEANDFANKITNWDNLSPKEQDALCWRYTFNGISFSSDTNLSTNIDLSLGTSNLEPCRNNIIKPYHDYKDIDNDDYSIVLKLNYIIFNDDLCTGGFNNNKIDINCHNLFLNRNCANNIIGHDCYNITTGFGCNNNIIGNVSHDITFGNNCSDNVIGNNCYSIIMKNETDDTGNCKNNKIGNYSHDNTLRDNCNNNIFGTYTYFNTLYSQCENNQFGNLCYRNTLYSNVKNNIFANYCYLNTLNGNCENNIFGNNCFINSLSSNCKNNYLGNNCYQNNFGTYSQGNHLGNNCFINTFNNYFNFNTFGNNCTNNKFGAYSQNNYMGNTCSYNVFGQFIYNISFGNNCSYNTFGSGSTAWTTTRTPKNYYKNIILDNGVLYINLSNSALTTSSTLYYQNLHIKLGVAGTVSSVLNIQPDVLGQNYEIKVFFDNDGELNYRDSI